MTDTHREARRIERVVSDTERFQHDPDAFCQLLAPQVVLVNVAGTRLVGRDAVRHAMDAALRTPLSDVVTRHEVQRLDFLRPDIALMSGLKRVFLRQEGSLTESFAAILTILLVREHGVWLIAAIQSTPVQGGDDSPERASASGESSAMSGGPVAARAVAIPGGFGLLPSGPRRKR